VSFFAVATGGDVCLCDVGPLDAWLAWDGCYGNPGSHCCGVLGGGKRRYLFSDHILISVATQKGASPEAHPHTQPPAVEH